MNDRPPKPAKPSEASSLSELDLVPDRALTAQDPDAFGYEDIAARVADLVMTTETPANVALFGPWGSGKSSFVELLRRALSQRGDDVPVVRYDAWKYGGDSLKRNFISDAAKQLGLPEDKRENRQFYRGLYEKRRTANVDFGKLTESFWPLVTWFAGALLILVAAVCGVLWLITLGTDASFTSLVRETLPGTLSSSAVVAFVIGVLRMVFDGARVDVEQDAPADEEFSATFSRLVATQHEKKRLVFFIDELDRCSAEDVVATLADVKNFLDQANCVFIIAADRDAIERALRELPQETPVDEEEPYYSTASAFLDKVFQHQLALPPLRERRLTRFARDLVLQRSEQGGLWRDLRSADDRGRFLDHVIYTLIPSHLRSPRRVKVLLNNFATNVRVAEARGVDWRSRAPEVAKLTVLRTEFPLLAADLHIEPRLPTLLLEYERAGTKEDKEAYLKQQSERVRRLLKRHAAGAVDRVLAEDEEQPGLVSVQRQQLMRYLERAASADVPDPTRDLIYLEAAGAAVDLADAELGDLVESVAVDSPGEVLEALDERSEDDIRGVVRLLADMANREFGQERVNIMTALMGAVERLDADIEPVAHEVVESLKSFLEQEELKDEQLIGALVLARTIEGDDDAPLTDELFDDDRLMTTPERLRRVALLADRLPERHVAVLTPHLATAFATDATVLLEPLRTLPSATAAGLIRREELETAVLQRLRALESQDVAAARSLADELLDAAQRNGEGADALVRAIHWLVMKAETTSAYQAVQARAATVIPQFADPVSAGNHVMRAVRLAPTADWSFWADLLPEVREPSKDQAGRGARAVSDVITRLPAAPESERAVGEKLLATLAPYLAGDAEGTWAIVQPALQAALNGRQWWASPEHRALQEQLHRVARQLLSVVPDVSDAIDAMLVQDVRRSLAVRPPTAELLAGVQRMGTAVAEAGLEALATDLAVIPATGTPAIDIEVTRTRAAVAATAAGRGISTADSSAYYVEPKLIIDAAASGTAAGVDALRLWLESAPPLAAASALSQTLGASASPKVTDVFGKWAERLSDNERTDFLIALDDRLTEDWISAIATHGTDEERLVEHLVAKTEAAKRADERPETIDLLVHLRPSSGAAQRRVADMILGLIDKGTEADFKNALRAVPAIGRDHRRGARLEEAFRKAAESGRKIPAKADDDLRRAGVRLPKKSFAQRVLRLGRKR